MTTKAIETPEKQESISSPGPKTPRAANVRQHKPRVATAKGKPTKSAAKGRKARKPPQNAKQTKAGSKTATVLDLLKRSGGATLPELMKATGWQAHSVRGFISATLGKKMGLAVASSKGEDGNRRYRVAN